ADTEFLLYLLERGKLSRQPRCCPGLVALYFNGKRPKHLGRVTSAERSKWGIGHLYEHAVWEVPQSYGNEVDFFIPPAPSTVIAQFVQYARARGFDPEAQTVADPS